MVFKKEIKCPKCDDEMNLKNVTAGVNIPSVKQREIASYKCNNTGCTFNKYFLELPHCDCDLTDYDLKVFEPRDKIEISIHCKKCNFSEIITMDIEMMEKMDYITELERKKQ